MEKILVIENDNNLRNNISTFLNEEGFKTFEAEDGVKGVVKATEIYPDLIICDINMPHLNGYQVYDTLQANQSAKIIPFIFLTAKTSKDDIRKGLSMGADDYITKPFDFDHLLSTIRLRLKKQSSRLQTSELKYKILAEDAQLGFFIIDSGIIVYANNLVSDIFGYNEGEIIGKKMEGFIYEHDKKKYEQQIIAILENIGKPIAFEIRALDKQKKIINLKVYLTIRIFMGKHHIIGNIIDITEQKQKEIEIYKVRLKQELYVFHQKLSLELCSASLSDLLDSHFQKQESLYNDLLKIREYIDLLKKSSNGETEVSKIPVLQNSGDVILKFIFSYMQEKIGLNSINFSLETISNIPTSIYRYSEPIYVILNTLTCLATESGQKYKNNLVKVQVSTRESTKNGKQLCFEIHFNGFSHQIEKQKIAISQMSEKNVNISAINSYLTYKQSKATDLLNETGAKIGLQQETSKILKIFLSIPMRNIAITNFLLMINCLLLF